MSTRCVPCLSDVAQHYLFIIRGIQLYVKIKVFSEIYKADLGADYLFSNN
jgi:hypothetical protein